MLDLYGSPPPFWSPLESHTYGLIVADPPWTFKNYGRDGDHKGAGAQYDLMSLADIEALPVAELAAPDCLLVLWACNPLLPEAVGVLRAWGFEFKTAGHWVKRTVNDRLAFGTGYLLRSAGEPFLVGTRGSPRPTRSCRSVVEGLAREHSRKPDEAYTAWAEWTPDFRRCDLFAREARPGYDAWGDETGRF